MTCLACSILPTCMQERMREIALATAQADGRGAASSSRDRLAPAPPAFQQLAGLTAPLPAPVLTVYTKGDLVPAHAAGLSSSGMHWWSPRPTGEGIQPLLSRIRELSARARVRVRSGRHRDPASAVLRGGIPPRGGLRAARGRAALRLYGRSGGVSRSGTARVHSGDLVRRARVAEADRDRRGRRGPSRPSAPTPAPAGGAASARRSTSTAGSRRCPTGARAPRR